MKPLTIIRGLLRRLPESVQAGIRARRLRRDLRRGSLSADEPEFGLLHRWVGSGDVVVDVGANYGVYTAALSRLVGPEGLVIAVEPLPTTFRYLSVNSRHFAHENVSLLNVALSNRNTLAKMEIPRLDETGLPDVYFARVVLEGPRPPTLTVRLDALVPDGRVTLVKIDAEGHELSILQGMQRLIERDRPVLIVEDSDEEIGVLLAAAGYHGRKLTGSPNRIYEPG